LKNNKLEFGVVKQSGEGDEDEIKKTPQK